MRGIVIVLILFFFTSCVSESETEKKLTTYFNYYSKDISEYQFIIFIPLEGCGACISACLKFAKEAPEKKIVVSLVHFDKKIVNWYAKKYSIHKKENIIIDIEGLASSLGLLKIQPMIYEKKENSYLPREVTPSNVKKVLGQLQNVLAS